MCCCAASHADQRPVTYWRAVHLVLTHVGASLNDVVSEAQLHHCALRACNGLGAPDAQLECLDVCSRLLARCGASLWLSADLTPTGKRVRRGG